MRELFGQVVFSVGSAIFLWEDVVVAAELWGDWARVRVRAREGLACVQRLDDEEDAISDEEIEAAADEFRYARDLVSAQEMEEWLNRWGLTAENWMDWIRGSTLRQKWAGELADLLSERMPDEEEVENFVWTEAVCSGDLDRLAYKLAGQAAIDRKENPSPDAGNSLEGDRARTENLARLEHSFRRFRERVLTPAAIDRALRMHRTEWTQLDCQWVAFPQEEKAREAALCVREDGRNLGDVAQDAGAELRTERIALEEIEPELRDSFLGVRKGDMVGPVQRGEEFALYRVVDKILPSEKDPADVRRAEETILKLLVDREVNDRVKWAAVSGVSA